MAAAWAAVAWKFWIVNHELVIQRIRSSVTINLQDQVQSAMTAHQASSFKVDRALLNSHFEAYKLDTSPHGEKSCRLPSRASFHTTSDSTLLGYKQLKDIHNAQRLVPGSRRGHAAYIDAAGFVMLVVLSKTSRPSFHPLRNLSMQSGSESSASSTVPSLLSLPAGQWLVCDGQSGVLTLLDTVQAGRRWSARVIKIYKVEHGWEGLRLLSVQRIQQSLLTAIQRTRKVANNDEGSRLGTSKTVFDVAMVSLPQDSETTESSAPLSVRPIWTKSGEEPVYACQLSDRIEGPHMFVAESDFTDHNHQAAPNAPTASQQTPPPNKRRRRADSRPQPYSWLQTPDSVTVIFQLPATLDKTDFRVHFSPQGLSLSLVGGREALQNRCGRPAIVELSEDSSGEHDNSVVEEPDTDTSSSAAAAIAAGRYTNRSLWAPIDPAASVWTWEKTTAGDQGGLLTLHLEKKYEETRWLCVFERRARQQSRGEDSSSTQHQPPMIGGSRSATRQTDEERLRAAAPEAEGHSDNDDDHMSDVAETIDPSDLLDMIQGTEKYVQDGEGDELAIPRGGGMDRKGLLHDALEPEDANVGRPAVVTVIHHGNAATTLPPQRQTEYSLAEAIPSASAVIDSSAATIVIRNELDGLVFTARRDDGDDDHSNQWRHTHTFPALSFVLASKRDMNKVYVAQPAQDPAALPLILAFENAPRTTGGASGHGTATAASDTGAGNLFVYYAAGQGQRHARSRVIRLGAGNDGGNSGEDGEAEESSGAFLGAALVSPICDEDEDSDARVIVCLCEKGLIVLAGVL